MLLTGDVVSSLESSSLTLGKDFSNLIPEAAYKTVYLSRLLTCLNLLLISNGPHLRVLVDTHLEQCCYQSLMVETLL